MNATIENTVSVPASEASAIIAPEKPKAAKPKAPAKAKAKSAQVAEIRSAAEVLSKANLSGLVFKPFGRDGASFVLRVPSVGEAAKELPKSADAKAAIALVRGLNDSVVTLTAGSSRATWVLHASGSFALYSAFAK